MSNKVKSIDEMVAENTGNNNVEPELVLDEATINAYLNPQPEQEPDVDENEPLSKLNKKDLIAKLKEAEDKRRGFQSEADQVKSRLAQLEGMVNGIKQQPLPQPVKEDEEPNPEKFLKDIDPDDPKQAMIAQAKYIEAVNKYNSKILKQQLLEEMKLEQEKTAILNKAQSLANKDPRFRNADGSPNLPAIDAFLNTATKDWDKLYDALNPTQLKVQHEQPVNVETAINNGNNGFPRSVTGGGSTPGKPRLPKALQDMLSHNPNFQIPPGAKIKF